MAEGQELAEAQGRALAGERAGFREASQRRREAIRQLTRRADAILAGRNAAVHRDDVVATLTAASVDPEAAARLSEGRLSAPIAAPTGFEGTGEEPAEAAVPEPPSPSGPPAKARAAKAEAAQARAEQKAAEARRAAEEEQDRADEAEAEAREAAAAADASEAEVQRLEAELDEARRVAGEAARRAREAATRAAAAAKRAEAAAARAR